jgi:hypothetical protein
MTNKQTAKWFERPNGTYEHGVATHTACVRPLDSGKWMNDFEFGKAYNTLEEACHAAESTLRARLSEAVEVMGGQVVWASPNAKSSKPC